MQENALGTKSIPTLFWQYSIPTVAAMLFLGVNTIVDGLFVGRYIGADALAAVNIAMPFSSFLLAFSIVIGIGAQSLIGRKLGEGSGKEANHVFTTALILAGGIAFVFAGLGVLFSEPIAYVLGSSEKLMPLVSSYISYLGLFLPCLALMMVLDYALKTVAMPVYAMWALVVAVISHMALNWLFIAVLDFGIQGAAIATGIAFAVAFIMAALPFLRSHSMLKPFAGSWSQASAKSILYHGASEGVTELGTGVTTFLFNLTLMRYVGEMGVAAFTLISYLAFIGNNVLLGLSDGVGAIISYNYGSCQMKRVKKALQLVAASAGVIGIGMFAAIFIFAGDVISLFLHEGNEDIVRFAVYGAKLYAFAFLVNGFNIVAAGYFTAIGNPGQAVLVALNKGVLWIVAGITILPVLFGVKGIWLTVPIAEFATLVLSGSLLYRHFRCS